MEVITINEETLKIIKQIRSIKKPREVNPLLEKMEKLIEKQFERLDVRMNQLYQENKRLRGL